MPLPVPAARTDDGVGIAVHDLGGRGEPVLMVHATGLHGLVWSPVQAAMAGSFRGIAPDLRGHGDSGPPPGLDFDWHGFATDILAVVDGLGLGRLGAVGHSSGATALLLAEQERPGSFRALYCYEPVIVPADPPLGPDPDSWLAAGVRRRRAVFATRENAYNTYASKPPWADVAPAALRAYVEHGFTDLAEGGVALKCALEHEARTYEMATAQDCYARLGQVACPVLLAWGSDSDACSPDVRAAVAARLPRARTEVLAGLGHLGPLQDPSAVAASLSTFLLHDADH